MTSAEGNAAAIDAPEAEVERSAGRKAPAGSRPGVFLMINSLETGGSERQFAALARSLNADAFRLQLGHLQKKGNFLAELPDLQHFTLGGSLYRWQSMKTRWRLARYLRRSNIAIAHAFDFYANLTLVPAARLAGTPVVIASQRQLGDLLTPAQVRAQAVMFRLSDCVLANSQAAADPLIKQGISRSKIVVIGNGLAPAAFASVAPALPRLAGQLRVGMIARMNARSKNHSSFLAAASRLKDRLPGVEFVLVGDGPLRAELERETQSLGLADRVRFLGDRRDIPAVLASLDISVLPSTSESLSNVILESMAAGVPVIAYNLGGNPELVGEDRGILVESDGEEALAQAIEKLLEDARARARLGRNARTFAEANFTLDRMRQSHEDLYNELLSRKNWSPSTSEISIPRTERPLKVSIVAASLRYVGGQSVQAELLRGSWQDDTEASVQLIAIDPPFPTPLSWAERLPGLRTIVREPLYLKALGQGFKDAEIAHIFSASYSSFLIAPAPALLMARLRRVKTIIHYHSGEARDHLQRSAIARALLRRADLLVVPSGFLVDVFGEFGLEATVVPNIVDLSQFSFRLRQPLRPHLICTRGFHPYYSVDVVVKAFAEVQKKCPEARLDLVGGGPMEREIRDLVRDMKLSGVCFAGVAPYRDIGGFYDRADIFINASQLDNMPVSLIEAFASGTPAVSTAPAGMQYVVEHERNGLLSPVGDHAQLAASVMRLLDNPELAARLACSAREDSRRYSWKAVRQQWLDLYRSLAATK